MERATSKNCVSIVTVMLLLRVKQLKSAEYKNIASVENIFVQSFSFTMIITVEAGGYNETAI